MMPASLAERKKELPVNLISTGYAEGRGLGFIPVILQVADALALLLVPYQGLAPLGSPQAAFKSAWQICHSPGHLLM